MDSGYREIEQLAAQSGLVIRGGFNISAEDDVPDIDQDTETNSLILFGNAGSSIWPTFSASREYHDGLIDPMNRWSERIGSEFATELKGLALFPFGGPPYRPFIQWAKKAESLGNSRLGMLIHPDYGLWHAYRFAIALPGSFSEFDMISEKGNSPTSKYSDICASCAEQPCLDACPVSAFSGEDYDVEGCYGFLRTNPNSDCRSHTCSARLACPEGLAFNYEEAHARFHMDAFFTSISARYETEAAD
jgi:hypothetical protein